MLIGVNELLVFARIGHYHGGPLLHLLGVSWRCGELEIAARCCTAVITVLLHSYFLFRRLEFTWWAVLTIWKGVLSWCRWLMAWRTRRILPFFPQKGHTEILIHILRIAIFLRLGVINISLTRTIKVLASHLARFGNYLSQIETSIISTDRRVILWLHSNLWLSFIFRQLFIQPVSLLDGSSFILLRWLQGNIGPRGLEIYCIL